MSTRAFRALSSLAENWLKGALEPDAFELLISGASGADFRVTRFRGAEELSRPYRFDIEAVTHLSAGEAQALIGRSVSFRFSGKREGILDTTGARSVHGIIDRVEVRGALLADQVRAVRLRLVPRLALLHHAGQNRIFQRQTTVAIVATILRHHRVRMEARLTSEQEPREHCVQYDETDFEFVSRLLAEAGIFYHFMAEGSDFEDGFSRETMVLEDSHPVPLDSTSSGAGFGVTGTGTFQFVAAPLAKIGMIDSSFDILGDGPITSLHPSHALATTRVTLRDYDYQQARAVEGAPAVLSTAQNGAIELSEVLFGQHANLDVTSPVARTRLLARRRHAMLCRGESRNRRFEPGYGFHVSGHGLVPEDASFTVVKVRHSGRVPEFNADSLEPVYENQFQCIPRDSQVPPCPAPYRQRPRQVMETARVVGGPDGHVAIDEHGCISVRFHWQRSGEQGKDDGCRVRLGQAWLGGGAGLQLIPRVGSEVVVLFEFGDVDRPVVVASVPNVRTPLLFPAASAAVKSGFRTRSLPGDAPDGHELSFDDSFGEEQMYLYAKNRLSTQVEREERTVVGLTQGASEMGEGYQYLHVATDRSVRVDRDQRSTIGRHRTSEVHGNDLLEVSEDASRFVHGQLRHTVGARATIVQGNDALSIGGGRTVTVSGHLSETVTRGMDLFVSGDRHAVLLGTDTVSAMHHESRATGVLSLAAGERLRFACGPSYIELTEAGIELVGPSVVCRVENELTAIATDASLRLSADGLDVDVLKSVTVSADEKLVLSSDKATMQVDAGESSIAVSASKVILTADAASLELSKNATLVGDQVHLNPSGSESGPSGIAAEILEKATSFTELSLVDSSGCPVAGARFVVEMSDGTLLPGTLDSSGFARVPIVPGACKVSFLDFDDAAITQK